MPKHAFFPQIYTSLFKSKMNTKHDLEKAGTSPHLSLFLNIDY